MSEADPMDNINQAKAGVRALKLGKMGFDYIEEACLAELKEMEENEDVMLHEYTVLIPKARAVAPSYYTTYKGLEIYMQAASKSIQAYTKTEFAFSPTLIDWMLGTINLGLCFNKVKTLNISWALMSSLASAMTPGYEVHDGDWMDTEARVFPTNRAFYVKEGSSYKLVYNREYGQVYPSTTYNYNKIHGDYNSTSKYDTVIYPDINASNRDNILTIIHGVYSTGSNPITLTIASQLTWDWGDDAN